MRTRIILAAMAVTAAAGCTATPPTPIDPGTVTPTQTPPSSTGPATPVTSGPAQPANCQAAELKASLGPEDGAAGSVIVTLSLTNSGTRRCELRGFPGVSYVAGDDGHQVGPAAAMSGERGGEVVLAPGAAARTLLKLVDVENYDASACRPTPVRGLRIYPPGDTASLFVERAGTGCAVAPPGDQIEVQTLTSA